MKEKPQIATLDDLFSTQEQRDDAQKEKVETLPLEKLAAFESHPFKVTVDDELKKLVDSIRENGILIPAIARPKGDGYELIAGHRRKAACEILKLDTMPVLVREMTDEQAVVNMVDSNVQRENVLPSEKAFAYKMKLEALKRQAGRPKINSCQVGTDSFGVRSDGLLAENSNESARTIQRFIRLTELIPPILKMVDEKQIAFNPAVELSYLPQEQQALLLSAMEAQQATPSLSQAQKMKSLSGEGKLDESTMMEVMREQKANQKEHIRIPLEKVKSFFKPNATAKEMEDFILKAMIDYQKKLIRQQNRDAR